MICVITGITGQDGSFLAEKLTQDGHEVHGLVRRSSREGNGALDHHTCKPNWNLITLHRGDLLDKTSIDAMFATIPGSIDEIYHMGAFTHVGESYDNPQTCLDTNGKGTLNMLEAFTEFAPGATFYHAATSELFSGDIKTCPQDENTKVEPQSPYAVSKAYAYNLCNVYACNNLRIVQGILFNHGSERRPKDFVTMKIVNGLCRIAFGLQSNLGLGNLEAKRDWGYAGDYMDAVIKMVRHRGHDFPQTYVVGSGTTRSVADFVGITSNLLNTMFKEVVVDAEKHVYVNPKFFRPNEVWKLQSDPSKIKKILKWKATTSLEDMIQKMILSEMMDILNHNPNLRFGTSSMLRAYGL